MIDLHGIVGTGLVHGAAFGIAALALPLGPMTICNCHVGGDPVAPFIPKPSVVTMVMEAPMVAPGG